MILCILNNESLALFFRPLHTVVKQMSRMSKALATVLASCGV